GTSRLTSQAIQRKESAGPLISLLRNFFLFLLKYLRNPTSAWVKVYLSRVKEFVKFILNVFEYGRPPSSFRFSWSFTPLSFRFAFTLLTSFTAGLLEFDSMLL